MHVFSSSGDAVILGLGTSLFGTMDRSNGSAAGMVGFTRPSEGDATQYAKVTPHPFQGEWFWLGDPGEHFGPMSRAFVKEVVAPLLVADAGRGPTTNK